MNEKYANANEGKGSIWYGMHFYPGVAEYREKDREPYRVFLNEDTIRSMDPSFAGRPVFVQHVDEVESDVNMLRQNADGWVIESFFNTADGKHWVKFIVVSEDAEKSIRSGMKLSNCYLPKSFGAGGTWNGVDYDREIMAAEFEHLAIVPNPRYEESVILSPEDFKKYNEDQFIELKRLANHKNEEGSKKMKFSFFKRTKVENSLDLESLAVLLPKSKKEVSIEKLINEADEKEMNKDEEKEAHPDHVVNVDGEKMTVSDLVTKFKDACAMKNKEESEDPAMENEDEDEEVVLENDESDDERAKEKALELAAHEETELKKEKKANAKEKAMRLKTAADQHVSAERLKISNEKVKFSLSSDLVARGKSLYGSK